MLKKNVLSLVNEMGKKTKLYLYRTLASFRLHDRWFVDGWNANFIHVCMRQICHPLVLPILQRTWQLLWWGRNIWCFTIAEAIRRADLKLLIILSIHSKILITCFSWLVTNQQIGITVQPLVDMTKYAVEPQTRPAYTSTIPVSNTEQGTSCAYCWCGKHIDCKQDYY